jgi:hypothetical protein
VRMLSAEGPLPTRQSATGLALLVGMVLMFMRWLSRHEPA